MFIEPKRADLPSWGAESGVEAGFPGAAGAGGGGAGGGGAPGATGGGGAAGAGGGGGAAGTLEPETSKTLWLNMHNKNSA